MLDIRFIFNCIRILNVADANKARRLKDENFYSLTLLTVFLQINKKEKRNGVQEHWRQLYARLKNFEIVRFEFLSPTIKRDRKIWIFRKETKLKFWLTIKANSILLALQKIRSSQGTKNFSNDCSKPKIDNKFGSQFFIIIFFYSR